MTAKLRIAEIFASIQGEGIWTGTPSTFVRVSGCNLRCVWCDTPYASWSPEGPTLTIDRICQEVESHGIEHVVLTGGEPMLQVDSPLVDALHARGFAIGVETNGTIAPPQGLDWICVSPKAGADLVVRAGHELKLVYPQDKAAPEAFAGLAFERFSLQPMDGPDVIANTARAIDYCLQHPQWRLSVQTHKTIGIR